MFDIGMICILISGPLFRLGPGGLMSADLHLEYGVKTKSRFKGYCFALVFLATAITTVGEVVFC